MNGGNILAQTMKLVLMTSPVFYHDYIELSTISM
jgi:hypothetical protein